MKDHRKILIAMNGSNDVLVQGLKLISPEKSIVTVVKVTPPYEGDLSLVGVGDVGRAMDGVSEKTVNEIKNIAEAAGVEVKVRIEVGEIDRKIVEVAEEEHSDLIIMGAGSQSSLKKLFLGSVLDDVTHQAPCPVLVVNSEKQAPVNNFYQLHVYRENKERRELAALNPRYH
ncbi:MAG TPA: universal stress protein [Thermodesulfovibrionales bacterium]|nr:universal stress protein [Thermodesulfovibrionales bacterium]